MEKAASGQSFDPSSFPSRFFLIVVGFLKELKLMFWHRGKSLAISDNFFTLLHYGKATISSSSVCVTVYCVLYIVQHRKQNRWQTNISNMKRELFMSVMMQYSEAPGAAKRNLDCHIIPRRCITMNSILIVLFLLLSAGPSRRGQPGKAPPG